MPTHHHLSANLGPYQVAVDAALENLANLDVPTRIWLQDYTVWKPEPTEISARLGWLHCAEVTEQNVQQLQELTASVREAGYSKAILLGMGGSSLAPEVLSKTFGKERGHLELTVLDSTVPGAVISQASTSDPARTLFIVSTKSGTTVETISLFKYFYNWIADALTPERAGEHFIAITDPGSPLVEVAERYHLRATLLNDPNIGGRYSALSYFGLAPAALLGLNLHSLLRRARLAASACAAEIPPAQNPGIYLGVVMGVLAKAGRDKLTLICSPEVASFGDWMEQLIAESTGKEGKGILPVVGEKPGSRRDYGDDRLFIYLRLEGSGKHDDLISELEADGYPVVRMHLHDLFDLGAQFFLWEMATAVAGHILGINPFDQPNVESSKKLAQKIVAAYQGSGTLPEETPTLIEHGISLYGDSAAEKLSDAIPTFIGKAETGAYVAIHAYLQPTSETDNALLKMRTWIRNRSQLAVTLGYGPRFLHSTGQLHKGDAGRGLFIQLTADDPQDLPIPDEAGATQSTLTFGLLKQAQASGDRQALLQAGRRMIRFHLNSDVLGGLELVMGNI